MTIPYVVCAIGTIYGPFETRNTAQAWADRNIPTSYEVVINLLMPNDEEAQ